MRIGALRDRVTLQNTTQTNTSGDAYGLTDTYTTTCVIWADVEQIRGERRYLDLTQKYLIAYRVTVRWRDDVGLTSRLAWGSRYLYINDISGDKAKGEMVLMCYERAAE